jgi:ribose 5-phosphate isomerase A
MKSLVARCLAKRVKDGEMIGLGSGTTAEMAIDQIGQRILREKIRVTGVPTSYRTGLIAARAGIYVGNPCSVGSLSWAFDGADEVDPGLNLIKGRGAAMLTEKILARRAQHFVIIVSEDKLVQKLGSSFPVPVELVPEALSLVEEGLGKLGAREVTLREAVKKYGPVVTEHNNLVVDAWFDEIKPELEKEIKSLVGVVESGLFLGFKPEVLVAKKDGVWSLRLIGGKLQQDLIEPA